MTTTPVRPLFTAGLYVGRRYAYHVGPRDLDTLAADALELARRNPATTIRAKLARPNAGGAIGGLGEIRIRLVDAP